MTNPVKLASALPSEYRNGLVEIVDDLVRNPADQRIALVVFDVKRVEQDVDAEQQTPTVRLRRLELPLGLDQKEAWDMMLNRATAARTNDDEQQPLPFTIHHASNED